MVVKPGKYFVPFGTAGVGGFGVGVGVVGCFRSGGVVHIVVLDVLVIFLTVVALVLLDGPESSLGVPTICGVFVDVVYVTLTSFKLPSS